jgi:4-carboxymuconolactone decarboxylase
VSGVEVQGFPTPTGLDLPQPRALMSLLSSIRPISVPWSRFAKALMTEGVLSPSLRELAILRVARRQRCAYAWDAHLEVARQCGMDQAGLALLMADRTERPPESFETLVLSAVDELLDEGKIRGPTRMALEVRLGHAAIVELTMLVGQYALLSMVCRTFDLPSEIGAERGGRQPPAVFSKADGPVPDRPKNSFVPSGKPSEGRYAAALKFQ